VSSGSTLIEARGLSAGYGKMPVVRDVDIRVESGEVVALLGANGAGKTTTLLTLAGELSPLAGEVRFLDEPCSSPMHARCRRGLGYVTEERSVIMNMSVAHNLKLARVPPKTAFEYFPALERIMGRRAGLCSGGEQQMLSLARALGRNPKVLLADELSLGLAPIIVTNLLAAVRAAADERRSGVEDRRSRVRDGARSDRVERHRRGSGGPDRPHRGGVHLCEATERVSIDDIEAIKQLKARYCRTMDTKDWSAMRAVFADDVRVDTSESGGGVVDGADPFIAFLRETLAAVVTVHQCHTPEIAVTAAGAATGIWAMEDMLRWPDGTEMHGYGHYHETYVQRDGEWRIQSLVLTRLRTDFTTPS
jgi:branched-chain amino acid transport system ATP-binding protein